jgi:hypothetical protein
VEEDMEVRPAIQQIALEHRRRYGSRRIANPSFLDFGGGSGNGVPGSVIGSSMPHDEPPISLQTVRVFLPYRDILPISEHPHSDRFLAGQRRSSFLPTTVRANGHPLVSSTHPGLIFLV